MALRDRLAGTASAAWASSRSSSPRCWSGGALLNSIANRLKVPFPIVLVIGGLLPALIPGIPNVEFDPDLVLVVFLPPLLY